MIYVNLKRMYALNFSSSLPFDWRIPVRYLGVFIVQVATIFYAAAFCMCLMGILVGLCLFLMTFVENMKFHLILMNTISDSSSISVKSFGELKQIQRLSDAIQFHSLVKELSQKTQIFRNGKHNKLLIIFRLANELSDCYELIILGYFTWGTITTCCSLLWLQHVRRKSILNTDYFFNFITATTFNYFLFQALIHSNIFDLLYVIMYLICTLGQLFLFCHFGNQLTDTFGTIYDTFYQCDWYLMPLKIQKIMPTILNAAQEPVFLRGFGNITCTREMFKKVFTDRQSILANYN